MPGVVALVDDIFFQAKLVETARQLGVDLRVCAKADAFASELAKAEPELAIIDLNARADVLDAIARVKSVGNSTALIGFLSHVQTELAQQAREAGCTEVMPRSKLTRELATILGRTKSHS